MMAAPPLEAKCIFSNFKMYLDDSGAQGGPTWHRPINVSYSFAKQDDCGDLRGKLGIHVEKYEDTYRFMKLLRM